MKSEVEKIRTVVGVSMIEPFGKDNLMPLCDAINEKKYVSIWKRCDKNTMLYIEIEDISVPDAPIRVFPIGDSP
jgi:hypothetical protein